MNFKDLLLIEKFYKANTFKNWDGSRNELYTEIFKNPTSQDLNALYKDSKERPIGKNMIRAGLDTNGNLYAWRVDVLHDGVARFLKVRMPIKLSYQKDNHMMKYSSESDIIDSFPQQDKMRKAIEKSFPKVEYIDGMPGYTDI